MSALGLHYRVARRAGWVGDLPTNEPVAPVNPDAPLQLRFLGTAGFELRAQGHTLVLDPFVSRPSLRQTLFDRLTPDAALIRRLIPHADDVLIGHAHHDHVLDGPELCRQTGARFIGGPDACNVARAAGLPESQIVSTTGREGIVSGPATVRGVPSVHAKVYFNKTFLAGNIPTPPPWPARASDLLHGLVLDWEIEVGGLRVVHIDSADFLPEEHRGRTCDVLCLCAIGRRYRPHYTAEAIRLLRPRWVIPCHWDVMSTPIEARPLTLPGVDLPGFLAEIREAGAEPVLLPPLATWSLPA